jgi:hypothetical protein
MPFKKITKKLDAKKKSLKERLIKEMRKPYPSAKDYVKHPLIIREQSEPLNRVHLIVVWDDEDWKNLGLSTRCSLAMRSFIEIFPEEKVNVTSSLGTTSDEAKEVFGINVNELIRA